MQIFYNIQPCRGRLKSEAALCRPQGWILLFSYQKKIMDYIGA
jgi:hypothetical protein